MSTVALVLAGGSGSRLWPLSRAMRPKPYLPLLGEQSLFQSALVAASGLGDRVIVVCDARHRFVAAEQIRQAGLHGVTLVLEPHPRGTGAALLLGATAAGSNATLVVLTTDHEWQAGQAWQQVVRDAVAQHVDGTWQMCRLGEALQPLVVHASTVIAQAMNHQPVASEQVAASWKARRVDLDFVRVDEPQWTACAAFESKDLWQGDRLVEVSLEGAGTAVTTYQHLWERGPHDADGNVTIGDVQTSDTTDCYVHAEDRLVVALGVRDLAVVCTADTVLITDRQTNGELRDAVAALHKQGRPEATTPPRVLRPWGAFECVADGPRYQVKRITVRPGAALSLQRHSRRAEHWVVVRGTARIVRGDEVLELCADASTYIPRGVVHRLENAGEDTLEIVEVQTGDYLGEDDIERLEDRYGRE